MAFTKLTTQELGEFFMDVFTDIEEEIGDSDRVLKDACVVIQTYGDDGLGYLIRVTDTEADNVRILSEGISMEVVREADEEAER